MIYYPETPTLWAIQWKAQGIEEVEARDRWEAENVFRKKWPDREIVMISVACEE